MPKHHDIEKLAETMQSAKLPAESRADFLIYLIGEKGLDTRPAVVNLIEEADEGRKLKAEQGENGPLAPETFIGPMQRGGQLFAVVTNGTGDIYLPCRQDDITGLVRGDPVLVDPKNVRIVGRDGALPPTGDVVTVESVPADLPGQIIVKHNNHSVTARIAQRLLDAPTPPSAGTRVVYNSTSRFVFSMIDISTDGKELLTDPAVLSKISRKDLGAPHPIMDDILFRMKMWVRHPEWMKTMQTRQRMSYLFVGSTGTGKTMHLKVLARELMDYVEELTGQRLSRLVMCDASSFYSPWFGQTEENITRWFDRIHKLGATRLRTRDGQEVRIPLLIVLEEAEALLRNRGETGGSSHLFDRPLALMLQKLDSITDALDMPLLFCSTTNRPDLIDVAARRRLGVAQITFGSMNAAQALSVLTKKVPPDMPIRGEDGDRAAARQALLNQVISYLFGDDPEQGLAEVRLVSAERRVLHRREVVTPAMIEQAISTAIDESIRHSAEAGDLLGIDAAGIVRAMHKQFVSLAATLRPHNIREHCPEWFADVPIQVEAVQSLMRNSRLPRSLQVR